MAAASAAIDSTPRRGAPVPRVSGGLPGLGHLLELRRDPIALMRRIHEECGEIGEMNLAGERIAMLYGETAQEAFFRAPEEQLDQAAAYPFMKPIFGAGVVFDATPEQRKQALRNQSLRDKMMRGHSETVSAETERMVSDWAAQGTLDALDFFSELTIYTSSACLIGKPFRQELGPEYVEIFKDLERGTDALAYVNAHLPIPAFWRRDRARKRLVAHLESIFERRAREGGTYTDLFSILRGVCDASGVRRYTDDQIAGMFISMMFAGHHTTSVVASWTLIELLRHPEWMAKVQAELDEIYADGREVSYQALREIPTLECCLKETLRLHPPLVILMRTVMSDFYDTDWTVHAGKTIAVSPAVSNRMPEHFPDPDRYDPDRYKPGREEDKRSFAWIPFGGGRHRCVGAAFAMMQLKAIFSVLLRRYEFEMAQPSDSYRNDNSKMVIQLEHPCRVRYRRRDAVAAASKHEETRGRSLTGPIAVEVDLDLCQGHGVCVGEAPSMFELVKETNKVRILARDASDTDRAAVEAAVNYCPTRALRWVGASAPLSERSSEQSSEQHSKE